MQAATANPLAGLDKVKDDMLKIINDAKQNQVLSFESTAAGLSIQLTWFYKKSGAVWVRFSRTKMSVFMLASIKAAV